MGPKKSSGKNSENNNVKKAKVSGKIATYLDQRKAVGFYSDVFIFSC